jgi:hypothetical protein
LLLFVTLISLSAYNQAFIYHSNPMDGNDMNNPAMKKPSIISNSCYFNPVDLTEYSYDTVRELTEINIPNFADAHPWISPDGLRLYYTNAFYNNQLVVTERANINSYFGTPIIVPIPNNWGISYWLSNDELDLYFTDSYFMFYARRDEIGLPFSWPTLLHLSGIPGPDYIDAQSLNSDQTKIILHVWDNGMDKIQEYTGYWPYYDYVRIWTSPPGFSLFGGQLSKDDLAYFTGAEDTVGKYKLYQMTRATPSDTFDISTFQLIDGINDTSVGNAFPTMSDNLEWVAFNRAPTGAWEDIDIYLAHDGILTAVFDPAELQIFSYAFPNPSSEFVCIKYKSSSPGSVKVSIYSDEGKLMYEDVCLASSGIMKINTSNWKDGFYCYRLTQPEYERNGAVSGKFIVLH